MKPRRQKKAKPSEEPAWSFWLYIIGRTLKSDAAFRNLQQICDEHLAGRYRIEVIDLLENPQLAREEQIVAVPMVVRKRPLPIRQIIGDLSNTARALAALDISPLEISPFAMQKGDQNI